MIIPGRKGIVEGAKNIGKFVRSVTPWEERKEALDKAEVPSLPFEEEEVEETIQEQPTTPTGVIPRDTPLEGEELGPKPEPWRVRNNTVLDYGPMHSALPPNPSKGTDFYQGSSPYQANVPYTPILKKLYQDVDNDVITESAIEQSRESDFMRDSLYEFQRLRSQGEVLDYQDKTAFEELERIEAWLASGELTGETLTRLERRRNALRRAVETYNIEGEIASHQRGEGFERLFYDAERAMNLSKEREKINIEKRITTEHLEHWFWTSYRMNLMGNYNKGTGNLLRRDFNIGLDARGKPLLPEAAVQAGLMTMRGGVDNQRVMTMIFGNMENRGLVGSIDPQSGQYVADTRLMNSYFDLHGIRNTPQAREEAFARLMAYMDLTFYLKKQYDRHDIITYNEHWGRWDKNTIGDMTEEQLAEYIVGEGWFKGLEPEDLRFYNIIKEGNPAEQFIATAVEDIGISQQNKKLEYQIDMIYAELAQMQSFTGISNALDGVPSVAGRIDSFSPGSQAELDKYREELIQNAKMLEARKIPEPTDKNGNPLAYKNPRKWIYELSNLVGFIRPHMEDALIAGTAGGLALRFRDAWLAGQIATGAIWVPDPTDLLALASTTILTGIKTASFGASMYKQMKGMLYKEMTNIEVPHFYDAEGNQISEVEAKELNIDPTMVRMSETVLPNMVATVGAVAVTTLEAVTLKIFSSLFRGTAPSLRAKYFNPNGTPKQSLVTQAMVKAIAWVAREGGIRRAIRLGSGNAMSIGWASVIEGFQEMSEDMVVLIGRQAANFENSLANGEWGPGLQKMMQAHNPHVYNRDVGPDGSIIGPWDGDMQNDINFGSSFYHGFMMSLVSMGLGGMGSAPIRAYKDIKFAKEFKKYATVRVGTAGETQQLIRAGWNLSASDRLIRGTNVEGVRAVYSPLDSLSLPTKASEKDVLHWMNLIEIAKTTDKTVLEPVRVYYTNRESMNLARSIGEAKTRLLEEKKETKKEDEKIVEEGEKVLAKETTFVVDEKDVAFVEALKRTGEWSEAPVTIENTMSTRILAETQEAVQENRDAVDAPERADLSAPFEDTAERAQESLVRPLTENQAKLEEERTARRETAKKLESGVFVSTDPEKPNLKVIALRNPGKKRMDFLATLRLNVKRIFDTATTLEQHFMKVKRNRKDVDPTKLEAVKAVQDKIVSAAQRYSSWITEEIDRSVERTASERGIEVGQAFLRHQAALQAEVTALIPEVEATYDDVMGVIGAEAASDLNQQLEIMKSELDKASQFMKEGDEINGRELYEGESTGFGVIPYKIVDGEIEIMSPGRYAFSDLHDLIDSVSGVGLPDLPAVGDYTYRFQQLDTTVNTIDVADGSQVNQTHLDVVAASFKQKLEELGDLFAEDARNFRDETLRPPPLGDLGDVPVMVSPPGEKRGNNYIRIFTEDGTENNKGDTEEGRYAKIITLVKGFHTKEAVLDKKTKLLAVDQTAYDPEGKLQNEPKIGEWAMDSEHNLNNPLYQLDNITPIEVNLENSVIADSYDDVTEDDLELIRRPEDIKKKPGDKGGILALKKDLMDAIHILRLYEQKHITTLPPIKVKMVDGTLEWVEGNEILLKAAQIFYGSDVRAQRALPIWYNPQHPHKASNLDLNAAINYRNNSGANSNQHEASPTSLGSTKGPFDITELSDYQMQKFVSFLSIWRGYYQRSRDNDNRPLFNFSEDFWRQIAYLAQTPGNISKAQKLDLINEMNKKVDSKHPGHKAYRDGWNSIMQIQGSHMEEFQRRLLSHHEVIRIEDLQSPRMGNPKDELEALNKAKPMEGATTVAFTVAQDPTQESPVGVTLVESYDSARARALSNNQVYWLFGSMPIKARSVKDLDKSVPKKEIIKKVRSQYQGLQSVLRQVEAQRRAEQAETTTVPITEKIPVMQEKRFVLNNVLQLSGVLNVSTKSDNFLGANRLMEMLSKSEARSVLEKVTKKTQDGKKSTDMTVWAYLNNYVRANTWDERTRVIDTPEKLEQFKRVQQDSFRSIINELKAVGYDAIAFDEKNAVVTEVKESERPVEWDDAGNVTNIPNQPLNDYILERKNFLGRLTRVLTKGIKNLSNYSSRKESLKRLNKIIKPEQEKENEPIEIPDVTQVASWVAPALTDQEIETLSSAKERLVKIPDLLDKLNKQSQTLNENIPILQGETGKSKSQVSIEELLKDSVKKYSPFTPEKEGGIPVKEARKEAKALGYPDADAKIFHDKHEQLKTSEKEKLLEELEKQLADTKEALSKESKAMEALLKTEKFLEEFRKKREEVASQSKSVLAVTFKETLDKYPEAKEQHARYVQETKFLMSIVSDISNLKFDIENATEPVPDMDLKSSTGRRVGFTQKIADRPKVHAKTEEEAKALIRKIKAMKTYRDYNIEIRPVTEQEVHWVDNPMFNKLVEDPRSIQIRLVEEGGKPLFLHSEHVDTRRKIPKIGSQSKFVGYQLVVKVESSKARADNRAWVKKFVEWKNKRRMVSLSPDSTPKDRNKANMQRIFTKEIVDEIKQLEKVADNYMDAKGPGGMYKGKKVNGGGHAIGWQGISAQGDNIENIGKHVRDMTNHLKRWLITNMRQSDLFGQGKDRRTQTQTGRLIRIRTALEREGMASPSFEDIARRALEIEDYKNITDEIVKGRAIKVAQQLSAKGDPFVYNFAQSVEVGKEEELGKASQGYMDFWDSYTREVQRFVDTLERMHKQTGLSDAEIELQREQKLFNEQEAQLRKQVADKLTITKLEGRKWKVDLKDGWKLPDFIEERTGVKKTVKDKSNTYFFDRRPDRELVDIVERAKESTDENGDPVVNKETVPENLKNSFEAEADSLKGTNGVKVLKQYLKDSGKSGYSGMGVKELRKFYVDTKMELLPTDYAEQAEEHVKISLNSRQRFESLLEIASINGIDIRRITSLWNNLHSRRHSVSEEDRANIEEGRRAEFLATEKRFKTRPMKAWNQWDFIEEDADFDVPIDVSSEDIKKRYDPSIPMDEFLADSAYRSVSDVAEVKGRGKRDKSFIPLNERPDITAEAERVIELNQNLEDTEISFTLEETLDEEVGDTGVITDEEEDFAAEEFQATQETGVMGSAEDVGYDPSEFAETEDPAHLVKRATSQRLEEGGGFNIPLEDTIVKQNLQKEEAFKEIYDVSIDDDLTEFLKEVDALTLQSMIFEYRALETQGEQEAWSQNFQKKNLNEKLEFARNRKFATPWSVASRQFTDRTRGNARKRSRKGPTFQESIRNGARVMTDATVNVRAMEKAQEEKREAEQKIRELKAEEENIKQTINSLSGRSAVDLPPSETIPEAQELTEVEKLHMAERAMQDLIINLPEHDLTIEILQAAIRGDTPKEGLLQHYVDDGLHEGSMDTLHNIAGSMKKLLIMFKQFETNPESLKALELLIKNLEGFVTKEESIQALFKKYKSQQAEDVKRMKEEREAKKNMDAEIRNIANSLSRSFLVFDTVNLSSTADVNPLTEEFSRNSPTLNNLPQRLSDPGSNQIWDDISGQYTLEEIGRYLREKKIRYEFGDKDWKTVDVNEIVDADKSNIEIEEDANPINTVKKGIDIKEINNRDDVRKRKNEVIEKNALGRMQREYWKKIEEIASDRGNNMMGFYWEAIKNLQSGIDQNFFKNYRSARGAPENDRARRFIRANIDNELTPKRMLTKLANKPLQSWNMLELEELNNLINKLADHGRETYMMFQSERQKIMKLQTKAMLDNFDAYVNSKGYESTVDEFGPERDLKRGKDGIPRRMIDNSIESRILSMRWKDLRPTRWADKLDGVKHSKIWGSGDATFDGPAYNLFVDEPREAQENYLRGVRTRHDAVIAIMKGLDVDNKKLMKSFAPGGVKFVNSEGKELDLSYDDAMAIYALNKVDYGRAALRIGKAIPEKLQQQIIDVLPQEYKTIADVIIEDYTEAVPRLNNERLLNEGEGFIARPEYHIPIFKYAKMEVAGQTSPDVSSDLVPQQIFSMGDVNYGFLKSYMDNPSDDNAKNLAKLNAEPRLGFATTWFGMVEHQERYIHMWSIWAKLKAIFENNTGTDVFQTRLKQAHGAHAVEIVKRFIERVGRGGYKPIENEDAYAKMFRKLRQNLGFTVLAGNLSTALKQGPSLGFFLGEARPKNLIRSLQNLVDPDHARQMWKFVRENDETIRQRNVARDLDELRSGNPVVYSRLKRKIGTVGMSLIYGIDASVVTAGAVAVYEYNYYDLGKSHEEAVRAMSGAIVRTQPASHIFDVAERYDTNNEFLRTILLFSNQLSNIWNMATYDLPKRAFTGNRSFGERIMDAGSTFIGLGASAIFMYMMAYREFPDDPEEWKEFLLMTVFSPMPVTGRVFLNARGGFTPIETSANEFIETFWRIAKDPSFMRREAGATDWLYAIGLVTGTVPAELASRLIDVAEGGDPLILPLGTPR